MQNTADPLQITGLVGLEEDIVEVVVMEVEVVMAVVTATEGLILLVAEDLVPDRIPPEEGPVLDHLDVEEYVQDPTHPAEDPSRGHLCQVAIVQTVGHQENEGPGLVHQSVKVVHQKGHHHQ